MSYGLLRTLPITLLSAAMVVAGEAWAQDSSPANLFRQMRRDMRNADRLTPEQIKQLLAFATSPNTGQNEVEAKQTLRVLAPLVASQVVPQLLGEIGAKPTTESPNPSEDDRRRVALVTLGLLGEHAKQALPALRQSLGDKKSWVAALAARSIARIASRDPDSARQVVPDLLKAAFELNDPELNHEAAVALGSFGDAVKPWLPQLRERLKTANPVPVLRASKLVARLGESAAELLPELLALSKSSDEYVRESALKAMAKMKSPEASKALLEASRKDSKPELRKLALEILAERGDVPRKQVWAEKKATEKGNEPKDQKPMPFEETQTSFCDAVKWMTLNREWTGTSGHRPDFSQSADSWDISIQSMRELLDRKLAARAEPQNCDPGKENPTEDFSLSLIRMMERSRDLARGIDDPHWSASDIYAKIYRSTLLRHLGLDSSEIDRALAQDVERLEARGWGGSALNTYAMGAAMVALGKAAPNKTYKLFEDWVDSHQDTLALRYAPDTIGVPETRKGSAARNVPVHLALYLRKKEPHRKTSLIASLENWMKYSGDLASHVPRNGTHQESDHGLAPYYFFSSLPYVTAAIKALEPDPRAAKMKAELRQSLPRLMKGGMLQLMPGNPKNPHNLYQSAPAYTYPLYGLALIPLIQEGDSCYRPQFKNDLGVVVPAK